MKFACLCFVCLISAVSGFSAVPSAEEIDAVMPQVKELTQDDLAAVKTKKKSPVQAAEAVLAYISSDDKPVTKFVLSRIALEQYVNGLAFDQANDLYSSLRGDQGIEFAVAAFDTSRRKLYGFATPKHPAAKALMKRILDDEKSIRGIISTKAKIKKDPKNAGLYEQLGVEYIACGDWDSALKAFKKSSGKIAKVAVWELGGSKNSKYDAAKVAKFWWTYSDGHIGHKAVCDNVKAHAAGWYKTAIEQNLLSGLDAKVASKRVEEAESLDVKVVALSDPSSGASGRGPQSSASPMKYSSGRDSAASANAGEKSVEGLYMVIDLEKRGPAAFSYLSSVPKDGWTDEYKLTKMVFRKIMPGSFEYLPGRRFTITKPYYIGVFEVTQKQFLTVMKHNPAEHRGDTRPVESVSFVDIRGNAKGREWPTFYNVDGGTFMGYLRVNTERRIDLPTEVQWEYACLAGEKKIPSTKELAKYARIKESGGRESQHRPVGSYSPNAWGLYDMLGNVWELCLDRAECEELKRIDWSSDSKETETDPMGPKTGSRRIRRGGCYYNEAAEFSGNMRRVEAEGRKVNSVGFRLVCPIP